MRTSKNLETANKMMKDMDHSTGFIQWKGTDVCMDFHCECGASNHYDGYFAYEVKCKGCGAVYAPSSSVELIKILEPTDMPLEDETGIN